MNVQAKKQTAISLTWPAQKADGLALKRGPFATLLTELFDTS